jgi:hypothetical protein
MRHGSGARVTARRSVRIIFPDSEALGQQSMPQDGLVLRDLEGEDTRALLRRIGEHELDARASDRVGQGAIVARLPGAVGADPRTIETSVCAGTWYHARKGTHSGESRATLGSRHRGG